MGKRGRGLRNLRAVLAPVAAGMAVMAATATVLVPALGHGVRPEAPGPVATHRAYGPGTAPASPAAARCTPAGAAESLRPSPADGPAVERIKQKGQLVVGVDQNTYRWGYRDRDTGRLEGFDIDLARAIAKDILGPDAKVVFQAVPTNQRIPAVRQRTVDMVVRTMTINCARKEQVAFSTAYFQAGQQVLAPKRSTITAFDDSLRGRRVCTAAGSTGETELARRSHGARVLTAPNQLDCLVRLQLGEADAVVTDSALAAAQAAQDPTVELKGAPFTDESYGVAMNKADPDLVRRVNKVLDDYRNGGEDSPWMRAYRKWLQADLPGISGPPEPQYGD
ncbi:glutamate ABC transporter substrate-binding protein [Streptomyces noursei]|uniref:glutamate ABC transporter substrate-binding protein n=1 Tax=Streptomyces noursei TaxID=1971 RepID=UPI001674DC3E|nr:glutamate ABC transporter substrate-binding protein [Streptomyces noursei]MCZ1015863.1 glutamate ABC transporter substrate-binding protein [Streptomyces noursei]GGW91278.1 sugar-binding protein [Streptomyces noursei]